MAEKFGFMAEVVLGEKWLLPKQLMLTMDLSYALTQSESKRRLCPAFPQFDAVELGDSLPYVAQHQDHLFWAYSTLFLEWR